LLYIQRGGILVKKKTILIFVAIFAFAFNCTREKVDEYSIISFMIGDVMKNNEKARIGDILKEKDTIQTGKDSFCDIRIGDSLIRVKQTTKVVLSVLLRSGNLDNTTIEMDTGKMLCKPKKLIKSETFFVKTPTAVAGVRGTQFTVEADTNGTSRIKVFEGGVRVAKRVRQLDGDTAELLSIAPEVIREEKVVITKEDAVKAEKAVQRVMKAESAKGKEAPPETVIRKAGADIVVNKRKIEKFAIKDFEKDNKEIIEVKEKPAAVIKEIGRIIEEEKSAPKPNGRLLVTRFEVYLIMNGAIEWEGTVVEEPVRRGDRLYIASGEYVFCASTDGPVIWKKQIVNEGRLEVRDNALVVSAQGGETKLDLRTGKKL
jgi:hypothetical protein